MAKLPNKLSRQQTFPLRSVTLPSPLIPHPQLLMSGDKPNRPISAYLEEGSQAGRKANPSRLFDSNAKVFVRQSDCQLAASRLLQPLKLRDAVLNKRFS